MEAFVADPYVGVNDIILIKLYQWFQLHHGFGEYKDIGSLVPAEDVAEEIHDTLKGYAVGGTR